MCEQDPLCLHLSAPVVKLQPTAKLWLPPVLKDSPVWGLAGENFLSQIQGRQEPGLGVGWSMETGNRAKDIGNANGIWNCGRSRTGNWWGGTCDPGIHGMPEISCAKGWGETRQCARRSSRNGTHTTGRERLRKADGARDCRGCPSTKGWGLGRNHAVEVGRRGCSFTGSISGKLGGLPQVMPQGTKPGPGKVQALSLSLSEGSGGCQHAAPPPLWGAALLKHHIGEEAGCHVCNCVCC